MDKKEYTPNTKNTSNYYYEDNKNEIVIKKLISKIWRQRKFVSIFTVLFLLLGAFIAFTSPITYTSSSTLVPQLGSQKNGSLGGIASMIGVNLGSSMSNETLSPNVYPQIIKSVPFCKEIMETQIVVNKSNGTPITLYDYYTNKTYQPTSVMRGIKKYTIGLPALLINAIKSKPSDEPTVYSDSTTGELITLTKKERGVISVIQGNISFENNPKEGYIAIGYSFSEPQATAVIAQKVYATLEKQVKSFKSQKQLDNLTFVEGSYNRARNDFIEKQANLAKFQDSNRGLTSAIARTTEQRLISEYEIAYSVYNELAKQLEQAKIAVNESTPVLTVINPVVVPNQKSGPNRKVILVVFFLLGVVFSTSWVLAKPFFRDVANELKKHTTEDMNENRE